VIDPRAAAFTIEFLTDAAWPAEEQQALGPWKLRATRGVTHRANSVLTAGHDPRGSTTTPVLGIDALMREAEAFYAERGLPVIFRLSPVTVPGYLDSMLDRRGYVIEMPTEAMAAETDTLAQLTPSPTTPPVRAAPEPDADWFDCAFGDEAPAYRLVHEAVVHRISRPRLFVAVVLDGRTAACGLGVSDGGWTGIYSMATRPEHRGRGLATAVLHRLAAWAGERGDGRLYLLVQSDNVSAKQLYARCGFAAAYPHHYRVKRAA
jgi:GNAT superfamily N-acetyltransferase